MARVLSEPFYRILLAQQANLARIQTGVVLEGTTGEGEQIELWGPKPDIIRLHDAPLRFAQDTVLENWERIITLGPLRNAPDARIVSRSDRFIGYQIQLLTRLTEAEIVADRSQVVQAGTRPMNPLSEKLHKLVYDFHHVFFDHHHLPTEACPNGLVDDQDYTLSFEPGIEYPLALVVIEVTAKVSGW